MLHEMRSLIFSSFLLLLCPLISYGAPPPENHGVSLTSSNPEDSSGYAILRSPSSGTRLNRGQPFDVIFSDPGTSASEARFFLSNYTGVFLLANFDFRRGHIKRTIILPKWVAEGTYDFMVSENDVPFGSDDFNMDVIICTVFVGKPRANQFQFTPFRDQEENNQNGQMEDSYLQKREPHAPKFMHPTSNESIAQGSQLHIKFLDGQLDPSASSARFILRASAPNSAPHELPLVGTSASLDGTYTFKGVAIDANITIPETIAPGVYSLIAQEVYPQSPAQSQDVASIGVQITANHADEENDEENQRLDQNSLSIRSEHFKPALLRKRATPAFRIPTQNQKIITGHHLNISLVNVAQENGKVRFLLRPIQTKPKQNQLVLFGRYAEENEVFHYENSTVNARVFFPEGIANETYNLVAQDVSSANPNDLASVQVRVQQIRPITLNRLNKKDMATSLLAKPSHVRISPLSPILPETQNEPGRLRFPQACGSRYSEAKNSPKPIKRESPTMLEPRSGQEVHLGSKFLCEVQDQYATSESVHFHLRSYSGKDYYLGKAKFIKGIAKLQATCPTDVQFDSYIVMARQNSIKKPVTFLDVISTTIVISHQPSVMSQLALSLTKRSTTSYQARLTKPTYNQYISAGKIFDCQVQNVVVSDRVRFLLRANDGDSDLSVGNCVAKDIVAKTTCQIPSSIVPGTYTLVVQKNSKHRPDIFQDVDRVTITLANPRGYGPDIGSAEKKIVAKRSLDSGQSQTLIGSSDQAQLSILIEPMPYQTIFQGQGFGVKLKNNTSPLSTKLRFLLESMPNSSNKQQYVLGESTNGEAVHETLRCPDHISSGKYMFVIQANDPNDLDSFVESSSTPIIVNDQPSKSLDSPNNSTSPTSFPVGTSRQQGPTPPGAGISTNPGDETTFGSPTDSKNSSVTLTGAPPSIDRSSTPLGPGYAKNNNNIFANSAGRSRYPNSLSAFPLNFVSLPANILLKLIALQSFPLLASILISSVVFGL